jgi:hypothetical protein
MTARSTSSASPSAIVVIASSVAGLITSSRSAEWGATQAPSM